VTQNLKPQTTIRLLDYPRELLRSFVPAAYPELAAQQASAGALYLAGVILIVSLLLAPVMYWSHQEFLAAEQEAKAETRAYFEAALPESVTFEDGQAHYDGEQPYIHVGTIGGEPRVLIVDTTGATTKIPDEYDEGMLITADAVIYKAQRKGHTETDAEPIPPTDGSVSARQVYLDALERRQTPGFTLVMGAYFLWAALVLFVVAVVGAAVGYGMDAFRKGRRLSFTTWFNVAAHAATPVAFVTASLSAARTMALWYALLGLPLLLFVVLMTFGAQACRRAQACRCAQEAS
jgi:hypothetical protein